MKNTKRISEKENERKAIAYLQIFILVIATIAFSWMIGGDVKEVSAAGEVCGGGGSCNTVCDGTIYSEGNLMCSNGEVCCVPGDGSNNNGGGGPGFLDLVNKGLDTGAKIEAVSNVADKLKKKGFLKRLFSGKGGSTGSTTGSPSSGLGMGDGSGGFSGLGDTLGGEGIIGGSDKLTFGDWINPFNGGASGGGNFMNSLANVFNTVFWAAAAAIIVNIFAKKISSARNAGDMTTVAWAGVALAATYSMIAEIATVGSFSGPVGWIGFVIVAAAVGLYMLIGYQKYSRMIFTYRPLMWNAPEGGNNCYKCNLLTIKGTNEKACSEYICQTYGKDCIWVNNATMYETCIQNNPHDLQAPVITPVKNIYGEDVFPDNYYNYGKTQTGSKIIYTGLGAGAQQCIPVFTPVLIAFTTDEAADCRVSTEEKQGTSEAVFSNMKTLTEGGASTTNHTLQLSPMVLMSNAAAESSGYTLTNNGIFKYYIKCQDNNGNINNGYYLIEFCTQKSDKQPPRIMGTSPANNSYIAYGTQKIDSFKVYLNEPAECRWDTKKTSYTQMAHTFDKCYTDLDNLLDGQYGCNTSLNGAFVYGENKYYVACVDKPGESERNVGNPETIIFRGTRRLIITDVKINGKANGSTIVDSDEPVQVEIAINTDGGAEEGKAICMYSSDGKSFSMFNNDGVRDYLTTNTETIYLSNGTYGYSVYCEDIAGNLNSTFINFTVKIDTLPPTVVRAYNEGDELKLITDEEATCVYSLTNCIYEFEEGTGIDTEDGIEHTLEWDSEKSFYVKCKDQMGMAPSKAECSMEVKPFEIAKG